MCCSRRPKLSGLLVVYACGTSITLTGVLPTHWWCVVYTDWCVAYTAVVCCLHWLVYCCRLTSCSPRISRACSTVSLPTCPVNGRSSSTRLHFHSQLNSSWWVSILLTDVRVIESCSVTRACTSLIVVLYRTFIFILAVMMMCGFCLQLTEYQWFYIHSALSCIYNYLF